MIPIKDKFVGNFNLKWVRTILFAHKYCYCLYTVKQFKLFLYNTNNYIQYLQTEKWLQVLLFNTNYSIEH